MKKIKCVIRQERLHEVSDRLREAGIGGITVTEGKGFGKETTRPTNYLFCLRQKLICMCLMSR